MDELTKKVGSIESSLHQSSRSLSSYKRSAESEIGSGVLDIKNALLQGQNRIEHVTSELNVFVDTVELDRLGEVDLRPQVRWLGDNISLVLADLESADSSATKTLSQSMSFQTSIADIGQDLAVQDRALDEARRDGEALKTTATQEHKRSVDQIETLQKQINGKAAQIRNQTAEASKLQSDLSGHQRQLRALKKNLSDHQARAEKSKDKAVGGGLVALGGLILAPITFGGSLFLTAAGAGYAGVKAINYDDLKGHISSVRNTISNLESSVQGANRQISKIESEKSSLESRLRALRSTLSQEDAAKERSEKQISEVKELGSDITSLQRQADTTSADVCDAVRALQELKSNLSEVVVSLSNETQQLTVESSGLWQRSLSRFARAGHSTRQLDAIKRATEALTNAQTKLPGLLPASCTKLLLIDNASEEKLVSSIVLEEIPKAF